MLEDIREFFQDLFGEDGTRIAERIIVALVILLVTWIIRRLLKTLTPRLVKRVTQWTRTNWDDQIINALLPPLRLLVLLWGLGLAIVALELPDDITRIAQQVLGTLVAFGIFWALFRLVTPLITIGWTISQRSITPTAFSEALGDKVTRALSQITKGVIVILAFAAVLETWGYNVGGLVAGLGIGGLAIALAAQDALANLFGYFVILADEPFRIGDYIILNGTSGVVEHVGFRSTRIRALDQSLISVPNNTVMNATITNWSRLSKRRLNMTVGIEYKNSPEQVLSVVQAIREMLQTHEKVQPDSVIVQFVEFNASSLDLMVICFLEVPDWGDFQAAKQDINLKIMHILDERGVSIAFPSRTVYLEQVTPEAPKVVPPPKPEPTSGTATDSPVPKDAAN